MTKEELLNLIKKGEAVLLDGDGKDVTKHLENPEESEELISKKVGLAQLQSLLKKTSENEKGTLQ